MTQPMDGLAQPIHLENLTGGGYRSRLSKVIRAAL
jgi:hypothetical protein